MDDDLCVRIEHAKDMSQVWICIGKQVRKYIGFGGIQAQILCTFGGWSTTNVWALYNQSRVAFMEWSLL